MSYEMTASNLVLSGDAEHQDFPVSVHLFPSQTLALLSYESPRMPMFLHGHVSSVHMVPPAKASRGIWKTMLHLEPMIVCAFKAVAIIYRDYFSH